MDINETIIRKEVMRDIWNNSEFLEWYNSRPSEIQEIIKKYPPGIDYPYQIRDGLFPYYIIAYEENTDDTITVKVYCDSPIAPRIVFGVNPNSLKPFPVDLKRRKQKQ